MALDKARLKLSLHDKIVTKLGTTQVDQTLLDFCDALADAIISEITANATVSTTGTVTSGPDIGSSTSATGTVN